MLRTYYIRRQNKNSRDYRRKIYYSIFALTLEAQNFFYENLEAKGFFLQFENIITVLVSSFWFI